MTIYFKKEILILIMFSLGHASLGQSQEIPLPKTPPIPKDNPMTKEKILLGQQLFFDPRLSKNGTVSCNTCHNVMAGGDDNRSFSVGVGGKMGGRSSPTVWNSAFNSVQFWDGRAATLEDQAKGPMTNPVEMAMGDHDLITSRLKDIPEYVESFKKVFGKDSLNIDNVAKAIAAYERTLVTPNARFDKYLRGNKKAINEQELRGYKTVKEVGCMSCHSGVNFNGPALPMGVGFYMKFPTFPNAELENKYHFSKDLGRFEVTKVDEDKNKFRVPTWRNVAITAPYFHNGSVATLEEAVRVMGKVQLNKDLSNEQVADIVAFLKTLIGERPVQVMPLLPPSVGKAHVDTN